MESSNSQSNNKSLLEAVFDKQVEKYNSNCGEELGPFEFGESQFDTSNLRYRLSFFYSQS